MALSAAVTRTKGKVEIQKMRRLRPKVDTHFFNTTLAKRTRVWVMAEIGADVNEAFYAIKNLKYVGFISSRSYSWIFNLSASVAHSLSCTAMSLKWHCRATRYHCLSCNLVAKKMIDAFANLHG